MIEAGDWLRSVGLECHADVVQDGMLHRFKLNGSRKANGWYWFAEYRGKLYGRAGDWKTGAFFKLGEDTEHRVVVAQRSIVANDVAEIAASRAADEWLDSALDGTSLYLKRKQVPGFGVRYGRGRILVPMYHSGRIVGIQRIMDSGEKYFTRGCKSLGASYTVGVTDEVSLVRVICEGYATAASIHMAIGLPITVAFNCGNLLSVARGLRRAHPTAQFIIAADNDRTLGNPGLVAARAAAAAVDGKVVFPTNIAGTDWNDAHVERGLDFVAEGIHGAL